MSVNLERHAETLVAAKRTADPERLIHESAVLDGLRHPGIVEHIGLLETDPPTLLTAWAGTDTWARRTPSTPARACEALASLAATISDLHDAGVSHRGISPEHVIVANDGRPILCSLGRSGPADPEGVATDIEALKQLVDHLRSSMDVARSGALSELAEQLSNPRRDLAGFIRLASSHSDPVDTSPAEPRRPRRVAITSASAVLLLVVAGVTVGVVGHPTIPPAAVESTAIVAGSSSQTGAADPPATTPVPTRPHTDVTRTPGGVPTTTIEMASAPTVNVVEHDGRSYGVGSSGDVVVTGDWNCDGVITAAVLQVSTGRVAVFDDWPAPNRQQTPAFTSAQRDAVSLMTEHVDGCDVLRAVSPYGSTIIGIDP